jgi:hypothetical protein
MYPYIFHTDFVMHMQPVVYMYGFIYKEIQESMSVHVVSIKLWERAHV